jgi:hypothetical protein
MLSRSQVVLALSVVVVSMATAAVAIERVGGPAVSTRTADRVPLPDGDLVTLFDVEEVDREVVDAALVIAERSGGVASTGRSMSAGMVRIARSGATLHAAPDGYLIPLVFTAVPQSAAAGLFGTDVSAVLAPDALVMNEKTATITGARVGDVVELRVLEGPVGAFRIAGIAPHEQLGGSEIVLNTAAIERVGMVDDTRVVVWGIDDRAAAEAAIAALGIENRRDTQVRRSWEPESPDSTLSTARLKEAIGEAWYTTTGADSLSMHPTWLATNLTSDRVLLNDAIRVRARCHVRIVDDLRAALADVAAAGLGGAIDVGNTNTYGGCYNPRYSRLSGFLSRHAYAVAIDMNTASNCLGCVPRMDCRVVRIFRRHGFAWGGNFRRPDGMHFEWVGERRDQVTTPVTYCPNDPPIGTQATGDDPAPTLVPAPERGREVLVDGVDELGPHVHDH